MEKMRLWVVVCIGILFIASCGKDTIPPDDVELGKEYYPLHVGHSVIYNVDSIIYNDFTKTTDTFKMEYKDVVASEFIDNEARPSFVIDRYIRQDSTFPWTENATYYATMTNYRLEVIENNLRMIKLVFPVKLNTSWYGNSFIPATFNDDLKWYGGWVYKYAKVNEPLYIDNIYFQSTVSIPQVDLTEGAPNSPNEYSAKTFSKEVYAKSVGLIYRELTRWEYQSNVGYKKGFTLILKAKSFE